MIYNVNVSNQEPSMIIISKEKFFNENLSRFSHWNTNYKSAYKLIGLDRSLNLLKTPTPNHIPPTPTPPGIGE